FESMYKERVLYRATGCYISGFEEKQETQGMLFEDTKKESKLEKIYSLYDQRKVDFGSSLYDPDKEINIRKSRKFCLPSMEVENL
ncbi:MAG TPA: hypothetical protein VK338_02145, partial [Candidatus Nitrosocosmicus sp.]|nr:hypothetical protein [Candidatus Nitrosocosmicus sp.]